MDAETNLAQDDRVHSELALVCPQPVNDRGRGLGLGGFAQDIGIYEISHMSSVDSEEIGTK